MRIWPYKQSIRITSTWAVDARNRYNKGRKKETLHKYKGFSWGRLIFVKSPKNIGTQYKRVSDHENQHVIDRMALGCKTYSKLYKKLTASHGYAGNYLEVRAKMASSGIKVGDINHVGWIMRIVKGGYL